MRAALTLLALSLVAAVLVEPHVPRPEDMQTASEVFASRRDRRYAAARNLKVEDRQAAGIDRGLDLSRIALTGQEPLEVEVGFWLEEGQALELPAESLILYLVRPGQNSPKWAVYQPVPQEDAEDQSPRPWGLFAFNRSTGLYDRWLAAAEMEQEGDRAVVRVADLSALPRRRLLVFARAVSGPDDDLWTDDAPNRRKGLVVR